MNPGKPASKRRRSLDSSSGIAGTTRLSGIRRITHSLQSLLLLNCHCRQQPRKAYENLDHHLQHEHTGLTKRYEAEHLGHTREYCKPNHRHVSLHRQLQQRSIPGSIGTPSGDWLHSLPLSTCRLRLDNEAVRVTVGIHLGTSLCEPHQCPCSKQVDVRGTHGLSCKWGARRSIQRHELNNIIY